MNAQAIYGKISPVFRRRRMRRFLEVIEPRPEDTILDLGGTRGFWAESGVSSSVTLLNRSAEALGTCARTSSPQRAMAVTGDACALPFPEGAFDVVFSNSVIEHVGTWERQQAFAAEARRVGRRLWIPTPAREFFIEPHLIAPGVHWLPRALQRRLIRNFTVRGWLDRPTPEQVEEFLQEVRLLGLAEMRALFPDCMLLRERFLGMTKSYIAVRTTP